MSPDVPILQTFYIGWAEHHRRLLAALHDLAPEHLALRTAAHQMAIWQIASHMAGARAFWFLSG